MLELIKEAINKKDKNKLTDILKDVSINYNHGELIKNALLENKIDVVLFLIDFGADIHIGEEYLLRNAALKGFKKLVKILLKKGADPYVLRCATFHSALEGGKFEIADMLLENDKNNIIRNTPGFYIKNICKNPESFFYLLKNNFPLDDKTQLLRAMAILDNKEGVDYLLSNIALLNEGNPTPLEACITIELQDMAYYLISKGADIHINNESILHLACRRGVLSLVQHCIENGSLLKNTHDILKSAVIGKHLDVIEYLLEQKIDVRENTDVALRKAVNAGEIYLAEFLIKRGSDINVLKGELLKRAIRKKDMGMLEMLIINGIDLTDDLMKFVQEQNMETYVKKCFESKESYMRLQIELNVPSSEQKKKSKKKI